MSNPQNTIVSFVPTLQRPAGALDAMREGDTVALPIGVVEASTFTGYVGQAIIAVGNAVTQIASVTVDGAPVPYQTQVDDQFVVLTNPLTRAATVVVTLTRPTGRFALLNGTLPPGLSLTAVGVISGVVANITATTTYGFAIRYSNATHVRDRVYTVTATARDEPAYLNPDQLAGQVEQQNYGFMYKDLGSLARGQGYAFTFDVYDPDGVLPGFVVQKITGFPAASQNYGVLPDGLYVTNQTIEGTVREDACPGRYYFLIKFSDSLDTSNGIEVGSGFLELEDLGGYVLADDGSRVRLTLGNWDGTIFSIEITNGVAPDVGLIPRVVWATPEGSLGVIEETEPCYLEVRANAYSSPPPTYALAPTSAPLPAGVSLNATTGRLYGVMPYVSSDTVFTFRLRATSGAVFADRDFSITVLDWFDLDAIHQLRLKMSITEEAAVSGPYASVIDPAMLYRPEDPSFGLIAHPYVYLIKGLDGTRDLDAALNGNATAETPLASPRLNKDYSSRFKLLLGNHKYAVARDTTGAIVYEVVYREMLDPMAKAGGFTVTNNVLAANPTQWPQSGLAPKYYFPTSVSNIRNDLIVDIGFAMTDATARRTVGLGTHELMPLWMRSEQVAGDQSTVIGYVPALAIAYLKPGSIARLSVTIEALMRHGSIIVPPNKVFHFDKYYTTETAVSCEMTFDDQTGGPRTIIDSSDLTFDQVDGDVVKYLN